MTVQEAARALEVSPDLVYRLCRAGRLAHARIGLGRGVIRIAPADLDAFKASRQVEVEEDDGPADPVAHTRQGPLVVRDYMGEMLAEERARKAKRSRG